MSFREEWQHRLSEWFADHQRDLPWRKTRDPYAIWVSEVMLQQTQVATVLPYYDRWMLRFPTVGALAEATEAHVLEIWQGLGYYRRAKLLLRGARYIVENGLPKTYGQWLKVPGVGAYTAAAASSICENYPAAVVDGNVERVFARLRACDDIGSLLHTKTKQWAYGVLDTSDPGTWNQAVMELGATVCTPRNPKCVSCPVADVCVAKKLGAVDRLPARSSATAIVRENHLVWVPYFEGKFGVRQIGEGEWWSGMWEFPRANVSKGQTAAELKDLTGEGWLESVGLTRHQVTNHRITIEAHLLRCESPSPRLDWQTCQELTHTPMASPQRRVLAKVLQVLGQPNPS